MSAAPEYLVIISTILGSMVLVLVATYVCVKLKLNCTHSYSNTNYMFISGYNNLTFDGDLSNASHCLEFVLEPTLLPTLGVM